MPRRPSRRPGAAIVIAPPEAEPSEKLKALYTAKPGFANYYFNRIELARVFAGSMRGRFS